MFSAAFFNIPVSPSQVSQRTDGSHFSLFILHNYYNGSFLGQTRHDLGQVLVIWDRPEFPQDVWSHY